MVVPAASCEDTDQLAALHGANPDHTCGCLPKSARLQRLLLFIPFNSLSAH